MCGLLTGGSAECWWTCHIQRIQDPKSPKIIYPLITNPSCLTDCYPADHCLSSLLADYKEAGGICRGSWLDVLAPGLFPVSNKPCELINCECTLEDFYNDVCTYDEMIAANCYLWDPSDLKSGLCSEMTKQLLSTDQQNCIQPLYNQKDNIILTTTYLIRSMCDRQTWSAFFPASIGKRRVNINRSRNKKKYKRNKRKKQKQKLRNKFRKSTTNSRLTPIELVQVMNGVTIARVPPLENTKNRYPWICSLRRLGQQSSHMCGVTLLSRPPGPTVLVTSAHCVYVCKSKEGRLVPNCCCPNVGPGVCTENPDCETNPSIVEITGAEAEIICGEWDTATDAEEDYNVILPIQKIIVHPDFNISRGEENSQFVASDISVIQVDDRNFEAQSRKHKIYPACLPSHNPLITKAIHSGWSKPPPKDYVTTYAPHYEKFYGAFSKQWHHSMEITKCGDPQTYFWTGDPLKYPTNSFYPPGTVCATEILKEFCPTSGESGSPLMVRDDQGRMAVEGIHSFIKARVSKELIFENRFQIILNVSKSK